jgi:hypothetical protein
MSRSSPSRGVWVVCRGKGFVVKVRPGRIPRDSGATQRAATTYARSLARALGCELMVQDRHGRIRIKDSHGNDPYPPKG